MHKAATPWTEAIRQAFVENERQVRVSNYRVACILALVFMPAGFSLDYFVYYPDPISFTFLGWRLLCSASLLLIWWLVKTPIGLAHYRVLGLILPALPSLCIAAMIYMRGGPESPYYAGLNLVLLGAALVLRWTLLDSLLVFLEVLALYLAACLLSPHPITNWGLFYNNLYFLFVTGVFVVIGSFFYDRLRVREFALRYELDQNRRQLEENNQKLLDIDQAKNRFFANVSHELRTPLTLLLAPLETLLHRLGPQLEAETRSLLVTMQSNGMRLLKLINDLLDLVRLESGRLEVRREPLDAAEFVQGLGSAVRHVAQERRITLSVSADPALGRLLADRDKLEKIVLNLLFNALKFTPAGGRVELRADQEDPEWVLRVSDTGMGISEKNLPHVFSRFWQADDSSRRKFQGMGIGLALVKELVEVKGGKVSVASQEGQGTTFTIRLPYLKAPPPSAAPAEPSSSVPASQPSGGAASEEWLARLYRRAELFPGIHPPRETLPPAEPAQNGHHAKVLVADDEPDMLRFLASQLGPHYTVIEATDGLQAVDKARECLPDAILLDMMMPEKDGLQACKELREGEATRNIPIILLTARADEETKLAALSAGASDFLAKPFSTTELHVRIRNLVDSYHFQRQLARQNQVLERTIEELKDTETQLIQTEKLASLGRMSAGIIHEINNPLNFAITGLYTLKNKSRYLAPEHQPAYQEVLRDIEEGLQRVKTIVSDLRSFSHHENEIIEPVPVAEILTAALRFLSHEWRNQIQVVQSPCPYQAVWGNKNKLIQVMVNLLHNAVDAIKRKTFPPGEAPTIWLEGRLENGRSLLLVRDNGVGVAPEHLDKIFDPFFTTKDVGEGMGLGLSIVYRLVRDFGGRIQVRSEPNRFCEFTLEFPVEGVPAAPAPEENHPPEEVSRLG
jgi:signal transduction histidine kinase